MTSAVSGRRVQVLARRFREHVIAGASIQGQRRNQEDRFLLTEVRTPTGPRFVAAVFDVVGGQPNGAEAAAAAARRLPKAVAAGVVDGFLLQDLDREVRATGGACTATIALIDDAVTLIGLGDSMAYDGHGGPFLPRDVGTNGRLTAWLGGRPEGHLRRLSIDDLPMSLCTDGVDEVLGKVRAGPGRSWVSTTLNEVEAQGAIDNATLIAIA